MVSVTIEYVMLIPLLFTQVIVFPYVASALTSGWQESQLTIEMQDAADHMASTIQQLYITINRDEILEGTITQASTVPISIGSNPYVIDGTLTDPGDGYSKILTIFLTLDDVGNTVTASTVLGPNVKWASSTFRSTSINASVIVEKFSNSTLTFSFGG
ncbi:hypothetical protein KJN74_02695 [Candidatus Bathyarchaeota archaeon]|nr:hypothetical protein [Candidatus Bathyarchaeota archaeon]